MAPLEAQQHDPERLVIEAVQQGDGYALSELMSRHGRWVRGVLFAALGRMDEVDDVAQQVWTQVWREAAKLEDPSRWRTWLYRIARNAANDCRRERMRRGRLFGGLWRDWLWRGRFASAADQQIDLDERHQAIHKAIAALPAIYREPFVLKHVEGWSYRQIAEVLGLPVDTVETRLVRARRRLREKLAGRI